MKSFLFSALAVLTLLIPIKLHAALYPLTIEKLADKITITMTGVPTGQTQYQLTDGSKVLESSGTPGESMTKTATGGKVVWTLSGSALKTSGAYYFTSIQRMSIAGISTPIAASETKVVQVNDSQPTSPIKDFAISPSSDGKATVSGKIDTSIFETPRVLTIKFYHSQTGSLTGGPTGAGELTAGTGGQSEIATDGTYAIVLSSLQPGAKYYFKQTVSVDGNPNPIETKIDTFTADKGYLIPGSVGEQLDFNSRSYHLLAPLPGLSVLMDPDLCYEKKFVEKSIPEDAICDVNGLLDYAFKLLIGVAAVLLVLRIMLEGYKILTTDVPFISATAKSNLFTALLGLLLALSAYLILNTINPKLVDNRINIDGVNVGVQDFVLSGPVTFDGKPIKVNFKKDAYPAAKKASEKTGVDTAFILAMFAQESGSGQNSGTCNYTNANMGQGQLDKLKQVATLLGMDYTKINMSCSGGGSSHGGAIGYTQFLPGTWLEYNAQAKATLGHEPNPWNVEDTIMMTALFLKNKGGAGTNQTNQEKAACSYFGSCTKNGQPLLISCGKEKKTYGQCVVGKKLSIQQQIDKAKAAGEIQ